LSLPAIGQRWPSLTFHRPGVRSVLIGARREDQLVDIFKTPTWKMISEEAQRLHQVSAVPPIYPYWH